MILPNKDKEIQLPEFDTSNETVLKICMDSDKYVVIHAGKTWTSRTFPKLWWDATISEIQSAGFKVVLIGHSINQKLGFVNVMTEDCIDLRNRLSLTDLVFLLKNCSYLLTNDSSPIHIAASSSKPYIAFISTVKHPDFLMHWRAGKYGYKMQNLGLDGVWNHLDFCPIRDDEHPLDLDVLPKSCPIEKILPDPGDVASHFSKLAEGLGMK
jgi:ADP-heptose:LPS heptosyltransferase